MSTDGMLVDIVVLGIIVDMVDIGMVDIGIANVRPPNTTPPPMLWPPIAAAATVDNSNALMVIAACFMMASHTADCPSRTRASQGTLGARRRNQPHNRSFRKLTAHVNIFNGAADRVRAKRPEHARGLGTRWACGCLARIPQGVSSIAGGELYADGGMAGGVELPTPHTRTSQHDKYDGAQ